MCKETSQKTMNVHRGYEPMKKKINTIPIIKSLQGKFVMELANIQ
jgi:hypothetical protein